MKKNFTKRLRQRVAGLLEEHCDADETITISRALEAFYAETYMQQTIGTNALELFDADTPVDPAAETFTQFQVKATGAAAWADYDATDVPRVHYAQDGQVTLPIRPVRNQIYMTIQDLRRAAMTGQPLSQELNDAARKGHAEALEDVLFNGNATYGVKGLFSYSEVVANASAKVSAVAWDNVAITLADILKDHNACWAKCMVATKNQLPPNTFAYGTKMWNAITRPMDFGGGVWRSALSVLQESYGPRGVANFVHSPKLDSITAVTTTGETLLCYRKDPKVLGHQTPVFFELMLPQASGMKFVTEAHSRLGGMRVTQPLGITYILNCT